MKRAILPGTFDPITYGHVSLATRAAKTFDELIVGVAAGVHKKSFFTLEERLQMTHDALAGIPNIQVFSFCGLLADFMHEHGCQISVRGLRSVSDFEFETQLAITNKTLDENLETVFFMPDRDFVYLSSTVVREVAMLGGDVKEFAPAGVCKMLKRKFSNNGA